MRLLSILGILVAAALGQAASSQTACSVGTTLGSATCGPSPGTDIPAPLPRPSGEWIKTWGAIATAANGDTGVSSGKLSKAEAEGSAMQSCTDLGNADCTVAFSYRNQCVAAVNPVGGGTGHVISGAATLREAVARATREM